MRLPRATLGPGVTARRGGTCQLLVGLSRAPPPGNLGPGGHGPPWRDFIISHWVKPSASPGQPWARGSRPAVAGLVTIFHRDSKKDNACINRSLGEALCLPLHRLATSRRGWKALWHDSNKRALLSALLVRMRASGGHCTCCVKLQPPNKKLRPYRTRTQPLHTPPQSAHTKDFALLIMLQKQALSNFTPSTGLWPQASCTPVQSIREVRKGTHGALLCAPTNGK